MYQYKRFLSTKLLYNMMNQIQTFNVRKEQVHLFQSKKIKQGLYFHRNLASTYNR